MGPASDRSKTGPTLRYVQMLLRGTGSARGGLLVMLAYMLWIVTFLPDGSWTQRDAGGAFQTNQQCMNYARTLDAGGNNQYFECLPISKPNG